MEEEEKKKKEPWYKKVSWLLWLVIILVIIIVILLFSGYKLNWIWFVFGIIITVIIGVIMVFQKRMKYKNMYEVVDLIVDEEYKRSGEIMVRHYDGGEASVFVDQILDEYHVFFSRNNLFFKYDPVYGIKARLVTTFRDEREKINTSKYLQGIMSQVYQKKIQDDILERIE